MAESNIEEKNVEDIHQLVTFEIQNEEFAIDILSVQEIIRLMDITKIPKAPSFIEGVINLRGEVIPIIDLRKRLRLGDFLNDKNTRIVVVQLNNRHVGFMVDSVKEVLRISEDVIDTPPPILACKEQEFLNGVAKLPNDRLIMLLGIQSLFSSDEMRDIESFEAKDARSQNLF